MYSPLFLVLFASALICDANPNDPSDPNYDSDTESFYSVDEGPEEIKEEDICQCGIETINTRILNGALVSPLKYPWNGNIGGCGATLISNKHLVTSANCVLPKYKQNRWGVVFDLE